MEPTHQNGPPARACSVGECDRTAKLTRGMCSKHYRAWLDRTPADQRPPAPRFTRRFEDYIDRTGECWIWTGPRDRKGYGLWSGEGERGLAHRVSLTRAAGTPPDPAMFACHQCDNPPCVRPDHLYWGTIQDNTRDYVERQGVHNKGARKAHCPQGHPYSGDNVQVYGGKRNCRECGNTRARERMRRKRATNRGTN